MNQQRILLPLWSHSIHGLPCTNSTVQSDVSFMLGCEHKNLLTFTVGCCVGEINVKHTHTLVLFMYEMKKLIQIVSGMSPFIKYDRYIWNISDDLVVACVLKMCGIMLMNIFCLDITIGLFTLETRSAGFTIHTVHNLPGVNNEFISGRFYIHNRVSTSTKQNQSKLLNKTNLFQLRQGSKSHTGVLTICATCSHCATSH